MKLRDLPEYNLGKIEGFDEGYQKASSEYRHLVKDLVKSVEDMLCKKRRMDKEEEVDPNEKKV